MSSFEEITIATIKSDEKVAQQPDTPEKENEPQEWLDLKREDSYNQVNQMFADIQEGQTSYGIQRWLRQLVNPAIAESLKPEIEASEIESLEYENFHSKSASEVAGTLINRPILKFSDFSEYQNFSIKLRGESSAASRGMNIPGSLFSEDDLLHKTGLIVSTDNKEFITHEIFHSIDPNSDKRKGYDRSLGEIFAYYQQIIVEANPKYYSHLKDPKDGPWGTLSREIDETYLNKFTEDSVYDISESEFKQLMKDVVAAIRSIYEKKGHLETQRAIAKSKTIEELYSFSKL